MDSFDEFRQNLNQKPENTRSSLIESQARSIHPADVDFEFVTERNKSSRAPWKTFTQSEQQDLSQYSSGRYLPPTYLAGVYDSSGKPLNLSDFRNDMDTELFFNNNNSTTYGPSNSLISQKDTTSTFQKVPCEYLKASCREYCHGLQSHQKEFSAIPRRAPQIQNCQNARMKSTLLPLQLGTRKDSLFDTLVKDHYYPGTIVDSVNGLIDFNKIAFAAVFNDCEEIPLQIEQELVPMTVLEAFDLRIKYEQDLRDDREGRKLFCANVSKTAENENSIQKEASGSVKYWTHRDELKLASTIDIDLMTKVSNIPETPLTEAINCLLKAEKIKSFDRNVHLAEEAIRTAEDGQQELAALKSTCSFKLDLRKDETKTTNTYEPLAIISYIGTTKPITE